MTDPFLQTKALDPFLRLVEKNQSVLIEELWSSPKALLLASLAKTHTLLVIGNSLSTHILDDLSFFGIQAKELPNWETLPGEEIPPSHDIVGKRFEVLYGMQQKSAPVIFTTLQGALQKVIPPGKVKSCCQEIKKGMTFSLDAFREKLEALGYHRVPVVSDKGEYAMRGGICDLFPLATAAPLRIDFFGQEIDSIRFFDPVSQKSIEKISSFLLTPAEELSLLQKTKELTLILDYLPKETLIIFDELEPLEEQYIRLKALPGSHSKSFAAFEELIDASFKFKTLFFPEKSIFSLSHEAKIKKDKAGKELLQFEWCETSFLSSYWRHPFLTISSAFSSLEESADPFSLLYSLRAFTQEGGKCLFLTNTDAEKRLLQEKLKEHPLNEKSVHFETGYLRSGFMIKGEPHAIIPYTEFSHRPKLRRQQWRMSSHTPASEFHELHPGDIVVHFNHGIAKFLGIEKRPNNLGQLTEFLILEYAEKSILFTPITQAHLVSRYIGSKEEVPAYSMLGSNKWQKTKNSAQQAIVGYAEQLLKMNAERALRGGFVFPSDNPSMLEFEEDFPFIPTEDQLRAIQEVKADMTSEKAMDRLICGDVGYGKTEVAMRSSFKAVVDGKKQVAVLVPTTVLALQHYESFKERMANFSIRIGCLSRFNPLKEAKKLLEEIERGEIDIIVGTHRLLSKDVRFHDLGLIIVDEEQRFGVRAKETLKNLKVGVDCLTLSATPIPRTLYMTIVGAKDISVINTPPQDRLPIKTIITERDDETIKNALLRELSREGQSFFIHNRVESIYRIYESLQKLVPSAKIAVSHGQMSAEEIDLIFHHFKQKQIDILIATTIVENGIDIPNANTIIIDQADQFGIADLYQLRGRVGRWNRPAYAYLLTPKGKHLPEIATKRLDAMLATSGYGGGLKLAMRDLEIRGAGDILGLQQSGHVSQIGFHLYCKLLKRTIEALNRKKSPIFIDTKLEFSFDASLPENYVNETSLRMELYHRLGDAASFQEVDQIFEEIQDRFGAFPESVLWLKHMTRLRIFAAQHSFTLLKFDKFTLAVEKQKGKQTLKKVLPLPKTPKPELFESQVIAALTASF